jgi:hypothetical protein
MELLIMKLSPEFYYEKPLSCLNFVHKQTTQAMLLRRVFLLLIVFASVNANAQLIISEYLEGASNDKCIEIFNTTSSPINLTGYSLRRYSNGGTTPTSIALSGTIPACGTFVICNSSSQAALLALADQTSGSLSHNGDDAYDLFDGTSVLDVFGDIGCDPGSEWTAAGTNGTANNGFIRNPNVCSGVSDPSGGCNSGSFTTLATEWTSTQSTSDFSDLGSHTSTCCGSSNTILEGSITGGPFTVDCSGPTTDTGTFSFTTTGTFNAGNEFTAELTNGTVLGTLTASGSGPFADITLDIPSDLATGTYDVQITSSDPNAVSGTISISVTQTGTCEPPHITSVIINSCNTVCQEGQNELVFGNTGDYSVLVNETNFNFSYTNTPPTLQNYTDNLTNNATTTQELNNECPATFPFIDAYGTTIPPSSSWILASDDLCPTDALDWAGLCFSGPIYVIYTTDPTWSLFGNFSNSTSGIRPYQSSITTTSGQTFTIDYETDGSQYPNDDGVFATFDSNGGPATGYGDDDCIIQPVLLPVELASFTGMDVNGKNTFFWKTVSERNSSHFELLNSIDGKNWLSVGSIPAAGYTESVMNYSFDHAPRPVINYYRLKQYDLDGSYLIYTKTITIDNREEQKEVVGYYNVLGQEITKETPGVQIILFSDGTTVKTFK